MDATVFSLLGINGEEGTVSRRFDSKGACSVIVSPRSREGGLEREIAPVDLSRRVAIMFLRGQERNNDRKESKRPGLDSQLTIRRFNFGNASKRVLV